MAYILHRPRIFLQRTIFSPTVIFRAAHGQLFSGENIPFIFPISSDSLIEIGGHENLRQPCPPQ